MPVTRVPNQVEFKPPSKKTIGILIALAIAFFFVSSLRSISTFYTDLLLFRSLNQGSTFNTLLNARFFVPIVAFVSMTICVAVTIFIATRFGKKNAIATSVDEWVIPFARFARSKANIVRNIFAIFIGLLFAGTTVGFEKEWILYRNSQTVDVQDPLFKKDIGFYLFELPFIRLVISWLFAAMVILVLVTFLFHYLNGSIRFERVKRHVSVAAKIHLSILCALAGLIKAAQYYFDRFALVTSTRGAVDGATYTDVNAVLPATRFLVFVAIIASILLLVNVYRRGVVLPLVAISLWLIVSIVVGSIYPLVIQNFVVKPSRNTKETPFTKRNIEATQTAFDLNDVEETPVSFKQVLNEDTAVKAKEVLANSLLWDDTSLEPWFQQRRGEQIYEFRNADRDRYEVDGKVVPAFVAARELIAPDQLPDTSWQSLHATFTHGFGAAIADGSQVIRENEPKYLVSDLPGDEQTQTAKNVDLQTARARLYFGEGFEEFVFVGSNRAEQTPTKDEIDVDELGGVKVDNAFKKAAFALRFSDYNILIADTVTSKSKIVFERDPAARVKKIAPFLDIDSNPYPVVSKGEVFWVVDAYTSSDQYPYSQFVETNNLLPDNSLNKKVNYVRNSVKAVVSGLTGEVKLYVIDNKDPIIKAYRKAFPKLFTDGSKAPKEIVSHYRYPEDLFNVQTEVYADYHVTNPTELLKGSQRWQVAPSNLTDTSEITEISAITTAPTGGRADRSRSSGVPLPPLYQYVSHTAMEQPEFLLTRSYVPIRSSFQMDSFLSASSDGENYGKMRLVSFDAEADASALSPTQAIGQINTDKEFSQEITLLDQRGSEVLSGPLQIVPVADTVVYVQPIYVRGQSRDSLPVLTYVTVSVSGRTVCAPTINQAIDALVSNTSLCVPFTQNVVDTSDSTEEETPPEQNPEPIPSEPVPDDSSDLTKLTEEQLLSRLSAASDGFQKAKDPLDLGALQKNADEMAALVDELIRRSK